MVEDAAAAGCRQARIDRQRLEYVHPGAAAFLGRVERDAARGFAGGAVIPQGEQGFAHRMAQRRQAHLYAVAAVPDKIRAIQQNDVLLHLGQRPDAKRLVAVLQNVVRVRWGVGKIISLFIGCGVVGCGPCVDGRANVHLPFKRLPGRIIDINPGDHGPVDFCQIRSPLSGHHWVNQIAQRPTRQGLDDVRQVGLCPVHRTGHWRSGAVVDAPGIRQGAAQHHGSGCIIATDHGPADREPLGRMHCAAVAAGLSVTMQVHQPSHAISIHQPGGNPAGHVMVTDHGPGRHAAQSVHEPATRHKRIICSQRHALLPLPVEHGLLGLCQQFFTRHGRTPPLCGGPSRSVRRWRL